MSVCASNIPRIFTECGPRSTWKLQLTGAAPLCLGERFTNFLNSPKNSIYFPFVKNGFLFHFPVQFGESLTAQAPAGIVHLFPAAVTTQKSQKQADDDDDDATRMSRVSRVERFKREGITVRSPHEKPVTS